MSKKDQVIEDKISRWCGGLCKREGNKWNGKSDVRLVNVNVQKFVMDASVTSRVVTFLNQHAQDARRPLVVRPLPSPQYQEVRNIYHVGIPYAKLYYLYCHVVLPWSRALFLKFYPRSRDFLVVVEG